MGIRALFFSKLVRVLFFVTEPLLMFLLFVLVFVFVCHAIFRSDCSVITCPLISFFDPRSCFVSFPTFYQLAFINTTSTPS